MKSKNVLATDLDGTLIPLADNEVNQTDLRLLEKFIRQFEIPLVFVTGRHLESVTEAITEFRLPEPDWIICDVGASVCRRIESNWIATAEYASEMRTRLKRESLRECQALFSGSQRMRLQEPVKQSDFKMSFYVTADYLALEKERLEQLIAANGIAATVVASIDPFNGDGLLDVLPCNVSKSFALEWWCQQQGVSRSEVVFAGDSGNDFAALTAGYRTILVGNARRDLIESVQECHRENRWENRLHLSEEVATSGVLDGCRRFDMFR